MEVETTRTVKVKLPLPSGRHLEIKTYTYGKDQHDEILELLAFIEEAVRNRPVMPKV